MAPSQLPWVGGWRGRGTLLRASCILSKWACRWKLLAASLAASVLATVAAAKMTMHSSTCAATHPHALPYAESALPHA